MGSLIIWLVIMVPVSALFTGLGFLHGEDRNLCGSGQVRQSAKKR